MIDIHKEIAPYTKQLENHALYKSIIDQESLKVFMEHHVYSVWDFMSLVKYLQNQFAPSAYPWTPPKNKKLSRFMNEIVLGEESDSDNKESHASHFELYCMAMNEVKANSDLARSFVANVSKNGLESSMKDSSIPIAAKKFMQTTFSFINSGKPHVVAAAFAFGRETIIPIMFQELLNKMNIKKEQAQSFHYYLERHIEVDGDEHGPIALEIISTLCGDNPVNWKEALEASKIAIQARIAFWDEVLFSIEQNKTLKLSTISPRA